MLEARKHSGLTQTRVCEALAMSQGTLAELERLAKGSSRTTEFAQAYGVNADWLATGNGAMLEARGWPFESFSQGDFDALSERQKGWIEAAMLRELEAIQAEAKRPKVRGQSIFGELEELSEADEKKLGRRMQ